MRYTLIASLVLLLYLNSYSQKVEYDKVGNRRLAVYLPEGYEQSDQNYKTVYFYDGQASFTNNPYSWKLHEKISSLISSGKIEKIVAVGIYTDVNRTEDLVPYYDPYVAENWGPYKPKGNKFDDVIVNDIITYIESKYKVIPESNGRALMGMSFAGLHALYTGLNNPTTFEFVAGISPSLWVDNYHFIKDTRKATVGPSIWFDIGTGEWNHYIGAIDALVEAGYEYGSNLFYYEEEDAKHEAKYWIKRVEYPLILFAGTTNPEIVSIDVITEVIPSSTSNKHFLRLNPVATRADGIKFSLASQANYDLVNPETGEIDDDGSFEFNKNYDMKVKVTYKDWEQEVDISNESVRQRMKNQQQ